jgi:hypothetical protein
MAEMTAKRWLVALKNRWPTGLALAMSALTFGGGESAEGVASFSQILLLLPLLYLVVAKIQRREATWPLLVTGVALVIGLRVLDVLAPAAVFAAMALIPGGRRLAPARRVGLHPSQARQGRGALVRRVVRRDRRRDRRRTGVHGVTHGEG